MFRARRRTAEKKLQSNKSDSSGECDRVSAQEAKPLWPINFIESEKRMCAHRTSTINRYVFLMRHNLNIEPIAMKKNNEKLSSIEENPKKERKKR